MHVRLSVGCEAKNTCVCPGCMHRSVCECGRKRQSSRRPAIGRCEVELVDATPGVASTNSTACRRSYRRAPAYLQILLSALFPRHLGGVRLAEPSQRAPRHLGAKGCGKSRGWGIVRLTQPSSKRSDRHCCCWAVAAVIVTTRAGDAGQLSNFDANTQTQASQLGSGGLTSGCSDSWHQVISAGRACQRLKQWCVVMLCSVY